MTKAATGAIPLPAQGTAISALKSWLADLLPGLLLTSGIAALAFLLRRIFGITMLSPMILSIVIGIVFHNIVQTPLAAKAGIRFGIRRILRFAIVLLGFQVTAQEVISVGAIGIAIIVTTLTATFCFTSWFGPFIGVDRKLAQLIAAGTSICGASAVIATNTVTDAPDEDVVYAVACVTVFGSAGMLLYPLLPGLLHLDQHAYGLWSGASIHEIAQVVAAAFQGGQEAGQFATIAKLSRVMLLAPVVLTIGYFARRRGTSNAAERGRDLPVPWFVFGFLAMIALNSAIVVPPAAKAGIIEVTTFLLAVALAAMGLETDLRKLKAKGLLPFMLGAAAWLFIAGLSLLLIKLAA
jgi:uncharacterized integral membrane protein (TIGR00698 family)